MSIYMGSFLKHLLQFGILIAFIISTIACDSLTNWGVGTPSKINQLYIRLNSKYKRDYDKNNYSLNYEIKDEKTIIIIMKYNHLADKDIVERVAGSAEEVVHRVAKDEYGIDFINVIIDIKKAEDY